MKLFILTFLATMLCIAMFVSPASATCGVGPGMPWYSNGSTAGNGYANCGGDWIQIEVVMQQNWGQGWYSISGTDSTTGYRWVGGSQLSATTRATAAYCGRWYRVAQWDYIDGQSGPWITGYANYPC